MTLPSETQIRFVVQRAAQIQHRLGKEIGARPLVLPTGKFFPDKFEGNASSVLALLRRMQAHAGMTDVPLEVRVVGGPTAASGHGCGSGGVAAPTQTKSKKQGCGGKCGGACGGNCGDDCKCNQDGGCGDGCKGDKDANCGDDCKCHHPPDASDDETEAEAKATTAASCGSGGCGTGCGVPVAAMGDEPRLVDLGDGWRLQVPAAELGHPVALTTNLARALGVVFLAETSSAANPIDGPIEVSAEIAACLLGFGSLLLAGSYIYSKSCGGPRIGRVTQLEPGDLALATVLFAKRQGHDLRPLLREMDVTQKDAVQKAIDWFDERPNLIERFLQSPDRIAQGDIPMAVVEVGLFARLFGKKKASKSGARDLVGSIDELESMLAEAPLPTTKPRSPRKTDPKADELRALVDEALSQPGSPIE